MWAAIDLVQASVMKKSPSVASFEAAGMRITFKSLSYSVPSRDGKGEEALLLRDVSGVLQPGAMTALMGPSGSGKTTLLDVLAGRKTAGTTSGTLLFGGTEPTRAFMRRFSAYVEQFDTLLGILTVEEMLLYTAEMKRPMSEPMASKKAAVEDVLNALALTSCRDVRIGNPLLKGISGGQAKRTNIGIALITNPRVIFLDEPTSGLDSYTANEVMAVVKKLVAGGVTICATIHSPTSYAFGLFESLMMLTRGRVVYFGPQGAAAIEYALASWPHDNKDGHKVNGAEWLVDLITAADRDGRAAAFADVYAASPLAARNAAQLDALLADSSAVPLPEHLRAELAVERETVNPWWFGCWTLIKYRTPRNYRDPEFLGPRIGEQLTMTMLMWSLYWGVGASFDGGENFVNQAAVLFMFIVLPAYGAASYVPSIVLERTLYTRERSDGLYYAITYLLAKMVDELLLATMASVVNAAATFHAIRFQGSFGLFWLIYVLVLYIGIVLAYGIAAISANMDIANALLPAYVTVQLFFAGFILDFRTMPSYWKWYSYLDFMRYAWGGLMVNQFSGPKGDPLFGDPSKNQTVLMYYQLKSYEDHSSARYTWYKPDVEQWANVGFLVLFFCIYFCCAWYALAFKQFNQR